jgi:NADH-quinone oxidoreductase subunit F
MTAAYYLSLEGCKVTVFEAEPELGGMLYCAIPSYRLPREVIKREIDALLNDNIAVKTGMALGRDINVDDLFETGYNAVLLALGAHKSRPLQLEGEDVAGVHPSIQFLKAYNLRGESLAKGRVGVIGGGNSAIDAARMALRQKEVTNVTILYRRTREEMPAFAEEIEAASQEGIGIETLVTPIKVMATDGHLAGLGCVRNALGEVDASGRRRPVPLPGTEFIVPLDTLIVAISEDAGIDSISPARSSGIEITKSNTVRVDQRTLLTNRPGVFAAGDVVTGPNTVVQAIAAGKKAAVMITRWLRQESLVQLGQARLPMVFVPPVPETETEGVGERAEMPRAPAEWRKRNFAEVEVTFSVEEAGREARRCLRCDLEFTQPEPPEPALVTTQETHEVPV